MVSGLLTELEDHNCQPVAEAAGHRGPHRLQHVLSGAVWDDQHVVDIASAWAAGHLDDGDEVYGGRQLRRGIRQRGMGYVIGQTPCD